MSNHLPNTPNMNPNTRKPADPSKKAPPSKSDEVRKRTSDKVNEIIRK